MEVTAGERDVVGDGSTVPSYGLADASLSLIGENWLIHGSKDRLSIWIRNIGDTQYLLDPFGNSIINDGLNLISVAVPVAAVAAPFGL